MKLPKVCSASFVRERDEDEDEILSSHGKGTHLFTDRGVVSLQHCICHLRKSGCFLCPFKPFMPWSTSSTRTMRSLQETLLILKTKMNSLIPQNCEERIFPLTFTKLFSTYISMFLHIYTQRKFQKPSNPQG